MVASPSDFQGRLGNLKFKAPIANKKGYPTVNYTLEDKNVRFQVTRHDEPHSKAPFGISVYIDKGSTPEQIETKEKEPRKNFDVTIRNVDVVLFLQEFEEQIIQAAILNKALWFKKGDTLQDAQIRSMFTSSLVIDDKYDPRLRTKVNCDQNSRNAVRIVEMQDKDGTKVATRLKPSDIMKTEVECIVIVESSSLWFQAKSFGMSYVSTDILVFRDTQSQAFAFDLGDSSEQVLFEPTQQNVSCENVVSDETNNPSVLFGASDEAANSHKKLKTG